MDRKLRHLTPLLERRPGPQMHQPSPEPECIMCFNMKCNMGSKNETAQVFLQEAPCMGGNRYIQITAFRVITIKTEADTGYREVSPRNE